MKLRLASPAEREPKEALEFYESARKGLGSDFPAEVETAIRLIESHPLAWAPMSQRTRRCRLHHFPFGLFYQVRADEILIISVMDLRRDPKRWEQYL